jgi:hypothetical protein
LFGHLSHSVFAAGIPRINPLKVEEKMLPGEIKEGTITLSNSQKEVMHLKIYVQDWAYDSSQGNGTKKFASPGLLPFSCSGWLRVYPEQLSLSPGESQKIRYILSVPADAHGGYHSALFFESALAQNQEGVVNISGRLASLIYVEVTGTIKRECKINSFRLTREEHSKILELQLDFKNRGNTHLAIEPTFNLLNREGALVARGAFPKIYTLPNDSVTKTTTWPGNLSEGVYDVILTVDLGENQVLVKEWKITVSANGAIKENLS